MKNSISIMSKIMFGTLTIMLSITSFAQQTTVGKIKATCRCPNCNIDGINLKKYKPGSTKLSENPLLKHANPQQQQSCYIKCDFSNANLTHANLEDTNFTTCIRGYVTPISQVSFANANMVSANLSDSKFFGVSFKSANLSNANLSDTKLFLSDFSNANLTGADLSDAESKPDAMHGWGSNFSNTNFTGANLDDAELYGNFHNANFTHANLNDATLSTGQDALNKSINSPGDYWKDVNFSYVDLSKTKFMVNNGGKVDLNKAIFCHTKLPGGKIVNRDCDRLNEN